MKKKKFIFGQLRNKNYSDVAVVTASAVNTTGANSKFEVDSNGKAPVILTAIAGKLPNRNIISGTVAEAAGLEPGNTYAIQVTEQAYDPQYGRRFNFLKLDTLNFRDIRDSIKDMGNGVVFSVDADMPTEAEIADFTAKFEADIVDRNGFYIDEIEDDGGKSPELEAEIAANKAIVAKLTAITNRELTAEENAELKAAEEYLTATV